LGKAEFALINLHALGALKAFRSLVKTVASLHQDPTVHRDIKPANIFIGHGGNLVLGDFGIVYLPNQMERLTAIGERVGSRDYMPQWADWGERFDNVEPNFDVYMLGKLLWCMVSGRLKLPREKFDEAPFDLTRKFPNDPNMHAVNAILEKCVVEHPDDCLPSAIKLLPLVEQTVSRMENGERWTSARGRDSQALSGLRRRFLSTSRTKQSFSSTLAGRF
jgi:serine/threonine protein kinase